MAAYGRKSDLRAIADDRTRDRTRKIRELDRASSAWNQQAIAEFRVRSVQLRAATNQHFFTQNILVICPAAVHISTSIYRFVRVPPLVLDHGGKRPWKIPQIHCELGKDPD